MPVEACCHVSVCQPSKAEFTTLKCVILIPTGPGRKASMKKTHIIGGHSSSSVKLFLGTGCLKCMNELNSNHIGDNTLGQISVPLTV